jgi:hypothetical protein
VQALERERPEQIVRATAGVPVPGLQLLWSVDDVRRLLLYVLGTERGKAMKVKQVFWRVIEHRRGDEVWYTAQTRVRRLWRTVRGWHEEGSYVKTTSLRGEAMKWAQQFAGFRLPIVSEEVAKGAVESKEDTP